MLFSTAVSLFFPLSIFVAVEHNPKKKSQNIIDQIDWIKLIY
jgi:hypothetical protein